METLGLIEPARNAQDRLRYLGLSIDENAMPLEKTLPSRELNVAQVGPMRKRQASWKQSMAEAAVHNEPLKEVAERLSQLGEEENGLWLTTNEGPECVPLDDTEFRINTRVRLDLPLVQRGLCQHQRRQKLDVPRGLNVWHTLTNKDIMPRNASSGETERNCMMWDVTSSTTRAAKLD